MLRKHFQAAPKAIRVVSDGKEYVAFDLDGINALLELRSTAKSNYTVLEELIIAYDALVRERNAIVETAKELETRSNTLASKWAQREEDLQREKDAHEWDILTYRVLLLLGLAIAVL